MFINALAGAIDAAHPKQIDYLSRQLWQAHAAGHIPDQEAQDLAERLHGRRGASEAGRGALFPLGGPHTAAKRYRIQRSPEQRSPDRQASIRRRRGHVATGPLPRSLAVNFTVGELAALKIVADEVLAHGVCDLSRNEIGSRAGVSLTVVKHALKYAEQDHSMITVERRPRSGRKHLCNIIRIVRAEWLDWLSNGRRKAYAIAACTRARPIFAEARGAQRNPPRVQVLRNSDSDRVDNSVKKRNRTGASPTRL